MEADSLKSKLNQISDDIRKQRVSREQSEKIKQELQARGRVCSQRYREIICLFSELHELVSGQPERDSEPAPVVIERLTDSELGVGVLQALLIPLDRHYRAARHADAHGYKVEFVFTEDDTGESRCVAEELFTANPPLGKRDETSLILWAYGCWTKPGVEDAEPKLNRMSEAARNTANLILDGAADPGLNPLVAARILS